MVTNIHNTIVEVFKGLSTAEVTEASKYSSKYSPLCGFSSMFLHLFWIGGLL